MTPTREPVLEGTRIIMRPLGVEDARDVWELLVRNRDFFIPTMPQPDDSYFTLEKQTEILQRIEEEQKQGKRLQFGIFLREEGTLAGCLMLANIRGIPFSSCILGYYLDERQTGRGLVSEAVRLACRYAFDELGIHRIEAGVMPRNTASVRVLERAGFVREGVARKNILIQGRWEDHLMFSLLKEEANF
ncbi:GNAT family N-acetyltransferase [Staphylospora marina]|uniref:GNAT family N-acetyltransferase n=1 Tax=Staphylospora marina TaxID=2490858 RepID=UPI000F5BC4B7|nr:GNAT family protein [Staphylospora marina]